HRDIKPANVMLTSTGQAKIADFGIAKLMTDEPVGDGSLTRSGAVLGTYRAMSPEQARGEVVDHRSDLFSFGVLLYELLAGDSPFEAENGLAMLDRIVNHRQRPILERRPDVPERLSQLVDHLLEKEPFLRPRSAGEVARRLEQVGGGAPAAASTESTILERPATLPGTSAASPARKRRRGLVPAVALLLALAVGLSLYFALRAPKPPLYVAVLRPEIRARGGELELQAAGMRVAILQELVALEGISPQTLEEVDDVSGPPREVAQAVAADELVGTNLDCSPEVCRVTLLRQLGADGSVLWAESFDVPADDSAVAASAVKAHIRRGFSGFEPRRGAVDSAVSRRDLDELLVLRHRFRVLQERPEVLLPGLEAIRRRNPRYLEVYLLSADVLGRQFWASRNPRDFDLALARIEEARRLAPEDPRALLTLVSLSLEARRLDLAQRSLSDLETLIPGDARLLEWRAHLLAAQGRSADALGLMRSAARLQPSSQRLRNLAKMELVQGNMDAARATLALLFERSPGNFAGLSLLAQIEVSAGNFQRAIDLYDGLVRRSPGLTNLSNLGLAYFFQGRYAEAAEAYRRALELQPNHPQLVLNMADTDLLLGRKAEAEKLYRQSLDLIAADPAAGDPQFLTNKAQALAHLGQGREAVAALQEALRLAPDEGPVAYEASLVYALLGEEDSALVNAERAVRKGIGERWFSLPWFASLGKRAEFRELLRHAKPGLG
ncbi:MAG TPA: tetratricopeptide repeat protein, partial [Thermoanaerobaculia bacterium]|nr:tetratricopeptide repeat protein [Thermoanaerobaculia bacterium]